MPQLWLLNFFFQNVYFCKPHVYIKGHTNGALIYRKLTPQLYGLKIFFFQNINMIIKINSIFENKLYNETDFFFFEFRNRVDKLYDQTIYRVK